MSTATVDQAQADAFLRARFGGAAGPVSPITEGEWSKAYRFQRDAASYVIRFSVLAEDFAKDRLAARFASPDLPIPQIVELGEALGGFYAISDWAPGRYLDGLDGTQFRAVLPSLFATLDAARRVDLSTTTGYGGWDARGSAPHATWRDALLAPHGDRLLAWRARLEASPTGAGPFDAASARLRSLVDACPEGRHLIHADLLHFNVLVEGDRLSAVLDWGCAMYGDFLYDIAWFAYYWPWYPAWHDVAFLREAASHYRSIDLEVPDLEARLRCYQVHIGLGSQAWNAFKGNWEALATDARRTLEAADGDVRATRGRAPR